MTRSRAVAGHVAGIGIVVPYWNPLQDSNRRRHLTRCLAALTACADARVICVEMGVPGEPPIGDVVVSGDDTSVYIWQKERLINHGFARLAHPRTRYLGYVDADCLFDDPGWLRKVVDLLDRGNNVVQAFSTIRDGSYRGPSAFSGYPQVGGSYQGGSVFFHAGLMTDAGGLYDRCIVGGGDFMLALAVTGNRDGLAQITRSPQFRADAESWIDRFRSSPIRCACADNEVELLPHGNDRRAYVTRHYLLSDFDPAVDLVYGDALSLSPAGRRLIPRLRAYTAHREQRPDIIAADPPLDNPAPG